MEDFDKFADDYKNILDDSLKAGGYKSDYFLEYKTRYIAGSIGHDFSGKILDYGCGVGLLSEYLVKEFPKASVDGFDVSIESINHVSGSLKNQGSFSCSIDTLSSAYDLIVVANVLHHVEPQQRADVIAKLRSLISPKGRIVIFEHNPFNPMTRKIVRESALDQGVILLPSKETVSYIQQQGLRKRLDYIVFFPKFLSSLSRFEPLLKWCPLGAQYVVIGNL